MKTSFLKVFVILTICVVISSAHKPHKHSRKGRDVREFKKLVDTKDTRDHQKSCSCENSNRKKRDLDENKMADYKQHIDEDDDYKIKSSKYKKQSHPKGDKSNEKHASKKYSKSAKLADDSINTSVRTYDTAKRSESEKDSHSESETKNSSITISTAISCLQKCIEILTKWKLY